MGNEFEDESSSPPPLLFKRLSKIPGYTWDESLPPFHSSYDIWHVFGIRHIAPSVSPPSPETTRSSSTRTSPRPESSRAPPSHYASSVSDAGSEYSSAKQETEKTYQSVVARISTRPLRLEREYHLCQTLIQTSDPECRHIVRSIEFRRLPSQQGDDGVPIAVSIIESPGRNWLRGLVSFGPAFYGGPKPAWVDGPENLGYPMENPISLPEFLDFAVGASECLELLHHGAQIVHGEIRGDAFHFNRDTGLVKLVNFGSGLRSFENGLTSVGWSTLTKEVGVKNKLQFIAPEQTGRMAAEPDSRTDIYSLGVLFWIMLTREPAFEGLTPMDILQGVLSKRIPSASSKRLDIPDVLSSIIQKMTQKHIDERYHSVSGLKHDFTELQKILGNGDGEALKAFTIGSRDVSSFFVLPSTMIGRQKEYDEIVRVIDKVSRLHRAPGATTTKGMYSMSSNSSMSEAHDASSDGGSLHDAGASRQNSSSGPPFLGNIPEKNSQDTQFSVSSDTTRYKWPLESKPFLASKNSLDSGASVESFNVDPPVSGTGGHQDGAGSLVKRGNSQKFHRNGRCEVVCISGAAGLGKSMLVQSVQVEARRHGYFASGKFDQAKKSPFEPVLKVMSSLFRQIFSEADVSSDFHNSVRSYVKPVWGVLHTMLELPEWILGGTSTAGRTTSASHLAQHYVNRSLQLGSPRKPSPPASSHGSSQGMNTGPSTADLLRGGSSSKSMRFMNTFLDVLRLLASHKVICLCIDDLHFADEESLELLNNIMSSKIKIVLIVTYRPEQFVEKGAASLLQNDQASFTRIELSPLGEDDILDFVHATLYRERDYILPLAAVVEEKSDGNPFYMREMLDACHRAKCLWYSWKDSRWEYDLDRVFTLFEGDDGNYGQRLNHDFIVKRLQELPEAAKSIIAWASLLGNKFSFSLVQQLMIGEFAYKDDEEPDLASDSHQSARSGADDAIGGLQAALQAYVLVPSEDDDEQFRFAHDRYIAAAGSLTACGNIEKNHFLIAQTMMKYPDNRSLYTRSSHICHAIELIKKRVEFRSSYRDLLCRAAEQASESGARSTALHYYTSCMALLQPDPWDDNLPDVYYEETLQLYTRSAECYWYQGNSVEALKLLDIMMSRIKSPEDKSPGWVLQSRILAQAGSPFEAFKALRAGLTQLGMETEPATWEFCDDTYKEICQQLQRIDREELIGREADDDRNLIAIGALLVEIVSAAFWSDALLFYQMALKEISLHLNRGTYAQVGLGYTHFAIIAISRFQELSLAVEMADISKHLMDKFQNTYTVGRGCVVHCLFISHIRSHVKDDLPILETTMDYTLSSGDRGLTLLSLGSAALCKLYSSEDLAEVEAFCTYAPEELNNWSTDLRGGTILIAVRQVARALQGKTYWRYPGEVLADEDHSSMQYIEYILAKTPNAERTLDIYNSLAILPLFLYGHIDKTVNVGTRCINSVQLSSMRTERLLLFYLSLALIAQLRNKPLEINKQKILDEVRGYKSKIEEWQQVNDVNYAMWSLLIHAEVSEMTCDYSEAIQAYEAALDHSQRYGFVLEEALCFGQQGEFYLRRGARRAARTMILESINAYARLNAIGMVKYVTEKHGALLEVSTSNRSVDVSCQTTEVLRDTRNTPYRLGEHQRQTVHKLGSETSEDRTRAWLTPDGNDASKKSDTPHHSGLGLDMIDLTSILESSQVISSELQIDRLLTKMLDVILDSTGGQADFAAVIVDEDDLWTVAASGDAESGVTPYIPGLPLADIDEISKPVALYALRFKETVFLHNLLEDERFSNVTASYSSRNPGGKSVIALPIVHGQDSLLGVLYLEGQPNSFTHRNITVLQLLVNQMGISIANAQLFKRIQKVSASNLSMIDSQKRALAQAREAEKKAKVAEAEALRNVRLKEEAAKAKSMFLANVSHELRTPLNGVIGMSELLKGTTMTKDQNEYADSIRLCADTLLTVINDILDFSKLEAGKMKISSVPLNLHETITEVVRALAFTNADRHLETIEVLDLDRSLLVMGDPVRLHQILMNLLSNSYKFTSKGSVTIRATTDLETSDSIRVTCSVADTGIGITKEQLKKLFLPFSQADSSTQRSYGGSGLGLSICKAIIENVLLGKIWLKSKPGVGTTVYFTLTFPKAPKDATATMSQVTAKDPDPMAIYSPPAETASITSFIDLSRIPREQLRICIAEDNPINQKIAISFVTKLGFKCDAYNDGMQAVEALRKKSKDSQPYHLVLMDVQMPVLDGYDATRSIRKDRDPAVRNVLVIAMTASAIRGDREKCLEAGMNDYLAKPVRAQVLKSKLEEYLNQPAHPIVNLQQKADDMARSVISEMGAPLPNSGGGGEFVLKDLPQRNRTDQDSLSLHRTSREMLRERTITPSEFKTQSQSNGTPNSGDQDPSPS